MATGDQRARAQLEAFRRHDVEVAVPSVVLVECTTGRGPQDASLNMVLGGCGIVVTTEPIAGRAAALRYQARLPEATIDAVVVATAEIAGGGVLLTGDLEDCRALAAPTRVRVETP